MALFERIFGYLDIHPGIVDAPDAVGLDLDEVAGSVQFESVRVNYAAGSETTRAATGEPVIKVADSEDGEPRWALDGVSFKISPG